MWEFCLSTSKVNVARFIYQKLKAQAEEFKIVLTCYEQFDNFFVVLACPETEKTRMCVILEQNIIKVICDFYKEDYLDSNIHLPIHEKMGIMAFKKALVNFDKETDFYIISRNLELKNNLNIDSFYYFKLKALREKWTELVTLANDNSDYLIGDDAFFDLLKFLIDNLEVCEDEISVFEKEDKYSIKTREKINDLRDLSKENLISVLIELSPKKINLYCENDASTANFLSKIFEERINVSYNKSVKNFH